MSVEINMEGFKRAVIRQVKPMMERGLTQVTTIMVEEFNAPKTGRQGDRRRASAPGEPPAGQSGELERSITDPDVREEGGGVVGRIRITARHAILLERGTPWMAPRPFVRPAIQELLRRHA